MTTIRSKARRADPRPPRTRARLLSALEALGAAQDTVTVETIVHVAGTSRSSFYSQFNSIGDVAEQLLGTALRAANTPDNDCEVLKAVLHEFGQHKHIYLAVIRGNAGVNTQYALTDLIADHLNPGKSRELRRYIAGGVLACTLHWLTDSQHLSEDAAFDLIRPLINATKT